MVLALLVLLRFVSCIGTEPEPEAVEMFDLAIPSVDVESDS